MSFSIPFDYSEIRKSNVLVTASNSMGKTLLASGIASNLRALGWRVIVFDTTNAWLKKSDVPYYQTIHDRHTPIYYNGESIIYELGLLTPSRCRDKVDRICEYLWSKRIWNHNHWLLTVFEESETFLSHRGEKTENIQRVAHCSRNLNWRSIFITTDLSCLDASKIRTCQQRYYGKLPTEENALRKFRAYHGTDWTKTCQYLDCGYFVHYNNGKMKPFKAPLFKPQTYPKPIETLKPKKPKGIIQRIKEAFSTEPMREPDDYETEDEDSELETALIPMDEDEESETMFW